MQIGRSLLKIIKISLVIKQTVNKFILTIKTAVLSLINKQINKQTN